MINDSLGIGEQLEAQMAGLIDTYECDWQKAINNPEFTKRFKSFVNTEEPAKQVFTIERGQVRPSTTQEKLDGIVVEIKAYTDFLRVVGI